MTIYSKISNKRVTPQSQKADKSQVQNSAGGYTFALDSWGRLDRWLILGSDSNTYYANKRDLTVGNIDSLQACIEEDGIRAVNTIVSVSDSGRAPKNEPAIFALAVACAADDEATRKAAFAAIPKVCRIGTHLFQFAESVKSQRGWGRGLRRAMCKWYTEKPVDKAAYQAVKYQSRDGWSHRDILRLVGGEIGELTPAQSALMRYIVDPDNMGERTVERKGREPVTYNAVNTDLLPTIVHGWEAMKRCESPKEAVKLIEEYGLTHEMVRNEFKSDPDVWSALLGHMPIGAMVRNLGKMTSVGLLKPLSSDVGRVIKKMGDVIAVKRSRLHPLQALVALNTYSMGRGIRGSLTWTVVPQIKDALDGLFYMCFGNVEATGKPTMLALDVSGSMTCGQVGGMTGITPNIGSAAMAMVTARVEPNYHIMGFAGSFVELPITAKTTLGEAQGITRSRSFGRTDCALPTIFANSRSLDVDNFAIYTDNETWVGSIHPHQALRQYRSKSGRDAKLAVVGMTATNFTIADPSDPGMMDVVGFDTAAPQIMANFFRG